jgi:protein-S-isoprenylcysteine O-methyltransferase Ste14
MRFKKIVTMNKKKNAYLTISILAVIIGLVLTFTYRPYIYSRNIYDFGIADTIGSIVSVIAFCFLFWTFKDYSNSEKNKHILIAVIVYSIIWEPMGLTGLHGTFDWKDIVATILSGLLTFILKEIINKSYLKRQ